MCSQPTAELGMQEEGLDTVDANRALGLPDDCREYSSVRNILKDLGIKSIRLMVRCAHAASARLCEQGHAHVRISNMMHGHLFVSSPVTARVSRACSCQCVNHTVCAPVEVPPMTDPLSTTQTLRLPAGTALEC